MALHKLFLSNLTAGALLASVWLINASQHQSVLESEKSNGPFDKKFEQLANETLERWKCPGLSIAVVDGDYTWAAVSSAFLCMHIIFP